jgi:hypothetical protein
MQESAPFASWLQIGIDTRGIPEEQQRPPAAAKSAVRPARKKSSAAGRERIAERDRFDGVAEVIEYSGGEPTKRPLPSFTTRVDGLNKAQATAAIQ